MPVATMANPPEHDFTPSWFKIPNDNQLIAKPHSDQRSKSKYPSSYADHSDAGRQRSRHFSNESPYQGYLPRHQQQANIPVYRSREEKRYRPGPRYHSLEDTLRHSELPSAYAPLQQNGFFSYFPSSSPDYSHSLHHHHHHSGKRSSLLSHNLNRLDSHGYHGGRTGFGGEQSQGRYGGGKHRGGSNKAGPENGEHSAAENGGAGGGGRNQKGEGGGRNSGGGDANGDNSALSSHDFPSLSGDGEEVKSESSKPTGAWEKRPETSKISFGGKKLQLVQKITAIDSTSSNGFQIPGKMSSPSGGNGVSNLLSATKMTVAQSSVQNKGQKAGRGAMPLPSGSTGMYKSLFLSKASAPSKASTPRKPIAKEVVIRPAPIISSKEKPTPSHPTAAPSAPSPTGGGAPSQNSPAAPVKEEASPRSSPAIDIPSPRTVTGKAKRMEKSNFLKELRRTGSLDSPQASTLPQDALVNGVEHHNHRGMKHHHHHHHHEWQQCHRSSTAKQQYERMNSAHIYQQPDPFEDVEVDEGREESGSIAHNEPSKCNGHFVDEGGNVDVITDNGHIEISQNDQDHLDCLPMELSSSLEAEKRLLQQMGWHEHSDNEEGYAPITEDELKEFKLRSQQMKKNGFSRPQPIILNLNSHPVINAMTSMVIEDAELSSSSDTSDDEL